jgi:hypothetical protein
MIVLSWQIDGEQLKNHLSFECIVSLAKLSFKKIFIWLVIMTKFFKNFFPNARLTYLIGLPRSGKSTALYAGADNLTSFFLDEPFALHSAASRINIWSPNDPFYDLFLANLDFLLIEQILGRGFNFRTTDKSGIVHHKQKEHIEFCHSLPGARDAIAFAAKNDISVKIALNFADSYIDKIAQDDRADIVFICSDIEAVKKRFLEKGWLSDYQLTYQPLQSQATWTFLAASGIEWELPNCIAKCDAEVFVLAQEVERVSMYVDALVDSFDLALEAVPHTRIHN